MIKDSLIILLLFIVIGCVSPINNENVFHPNKISMVKYSNQMGNYLLVFKYDTTSYVIIQTYPEGPPHYESIVEVYKDTTLISTFNCQYTGGKCYEDDPSELVYKAYHLRWDRWKNKKEMVVDSSGGDWPNIVISN